MDDLKAIFKGLYSPPLPTRRVMIFKKSSGGIFPFTKRSISEVLDGHVSPPMVTSQWRISPDGIDAEEPSAWEKRNVPGVFFQAIEDEEDQESP